MGFRDQVDGEIYNCFKICLKRNSSRHIYGYPSWKVANYHNWELPVDLPIRSRKTITTSSVLLFLAFQYCTDLYIYCSWLQTIHSQCRIGDNYHLGILIAKIINIHFGSVLWWAGYLCFICVEFHSYFTLGILVFRDIVGFIYYTVSHVGSMRFLEIGQALVLDKLANTILNKCRQHVSILTFQITNP